MVLGVGPVGIAAVRQIFYVSLFFKLEFQYIFWGNRKKCFTW